LARRVPVFSGCSHGVFSGGGSARFPVGVGGGGGGGAHAAIAAHEHLNLISRGAEHTSLN